MIESEQSLKADFQLTREEKDKLVALAKMHQITLGVLLKKIILQSISDHE